MADYVFFGHGNRDAGTTSTGTYVIPQGVNVHFFEKDGQLLNMAGARVLLDWMLTDHPYMDAIANEVKTKGETKGPYSTIPDYIFTGDANAAKKCDMPATGVYLVRQPKANGPVIPLATGVRRRLSSILGSKNAALGTNIYWVCCRAAKVDTNVATEKANVTHLKTTAGNFPIAGEQAAAAAGLKPSQVVGRGGSWR